MTEIRSNDDAARVLWRNFAIADGAHQASQDIARANPGADSRTLEQMARDHADGHISEADLVAMRDNPGFSDELREAADYLLSNRADLEAIDGGNIDGDVGTITRDDVTGYADAHWQAMFGLVPSAAPASASVIDDPCTQDLQQAGQIRDQALASIGVPVKQWTSVEAAQYTAYLANAAQTGGTALADALIAVSTAELQRCADLLGSATENKNDIEQDVKALTQYLSMLGSAASDEVGSALAMAIAEKIPEDSEQNWVDDGFGQYVDSTGDSRFLEMLGAALASQGKGQAADEMLHTSAGGVFGEGGIFDDAVGAVRDFPGNALEFAYNKVLNPVGDWLRGQISDVLGIEERISQLSAPGDMIFVGADIAGRLLGIELGAAAGVQITLLDGGRYRVEVLGQGSAGLAAELDIPGVPAGASASASAEVEQGVSFAFEFDSAADVTQAAEAITGMVAGAALLGTPAAPLAAAMLAATADELGFIRDNYAGTSIELTAAFQAGVEGNDDAALSSALEIPDINGMVAGSVRLYLPADGSPQLVVSGQMSLEGELELGEAMSLPNGSVLSGNLQGAATLQIQTSIPIDIDLDGLSSDPVGVVLDAVGNAASGAQTRIDGVVNLQEGVEIDAPVVGGVATSSQGVQIQFSAEAGTADMFVALGQAATGNLIGGLSTLDPADEVDFTVRSFTQIGLGAGDITEFVDGNADNDPDDGLKISALGGEVEITVGYAQQNSTILWQGTAGELMSAYGDLLEDAVFHA